MTVEKRQSRLAKNGEDTERWMRRLFRAATELKRLSAERKRLLKGPGGKLKYRGEIPLGAAGGDAVEGLDDEPGF